MADKFGMMSQAYFKGKRELLGWISSFLEMDIPKVEVLASGAHYCQLLDALYPGSVKMSKVNFGAYMEQTFVQNWKLVQNVFGKQKIQKCIPVQRLVKARFQDNLEFLQWFHQFFVSSYHGSRDYCPVDRRKRCKGAQRQSGRNKRRRMNENQPMANQRLSVKNKTQRDTENQPTGKKDRGKDNRFSSSICKTGANEKLKSEVRKLKEEKVVLEKELNRVSSTAKAIESERDFYFQVLLKVETMCKESGNPDNPDIKKIREILYSSNDDAAKGKAGNVGEEGGEIGEDEGGDVGEEEGEDQAVDLGQGELLVEDAAMS